MQKIFIEFRYGINEKEYRISCEPNSPFDDCEKLIELFKNDLSAIKESQKPAEESPVEQEIKQDQPAES